MAKFEFRLATLLRLRESTRDERRAELGAAYQRERALQDQLDLVTAELDGLRQMRRTVAGPGAVDVDRLAEAQRYSLVAKSGQDRILARLAVVREEIEQRREVLVEADREVRLLEKLREKQADQFRRDDDRRESKRLDEVAAQNAMRGAPS